MKVHKAKGLREREDLLSKLKGTTSVHSRNVLKTMEL
jgi:hypothetical protein